MLLPFRSNCWFALLAVSNWQNARSHACAQYAYPHMRAHTHARAHIHTHAHTRAHTHTHTHTHTWAGMVTYSHPQEDQQGALKHAKRPPGVCLVLVPDVPQTVHYQVLMPECHDRGTCTLNPPLAAQVLHHERPKCCVLPSPLHSSILCLACSTTGRTAPAPEEPPPLPLKAPPSPAQQDQALRAILDQARRLVADAAAATAISLKPGCPPTSLPRQQQQQQQLQGGQGQDAMETRPYPAEQQQGQLQAEAQALAAQLLAHTSTYRPGGMCEA